MDQSPCALLRAAVRWCASNEFPSPVALAVWFEDDQDDGELDEYPITGCHLKPAADAPPMADADLFSVALAWSWRARGLKARRLEIRFRGAAAVRMKVRPYLGTLPTAPPDPGRLSSEIVDTITILEEEGRRMTTGPLLAALARTGKVYAESTTVKKLAQAVQG